MNLKLLTLLLVCNISSLHAINRYWIANSPGNWNDSANWSASDGGVGGASIPGSSDYVLFTSNGLGTCNFDIDVDVKGIITNTGFTGIINQNTYRLDIGSSNLSINDGAFNGGSNDIAVTGALNLNGGTLVSTSAKMYLSSDFTVAGGIFSHNNGTIEYRGANTKTFKTNSPAPRFYNVINNKDHNSKLIIEAGDTLIVENKLTCSNGKFQYNHVYVEGDIQFNNGWDGGSTKLTIGGSGDSQFELNNGDWAENNWVINKDNTSAKVTIIDLDDDGTLDLGISTKSITINSGVLAFESGVDVSLNFGEVFIEANGTFQAADQSISFSGDYENNNGTFLHNNGLFIFDGANDLEYTCNNATMDEFYNVQINFTNDARKVKILNNDTLKVLNKLELINGLLQFGNVAVKDSCIMSSTWDGGECDFWVIGDGTSKVFYDDNKWTSSNLYVDKQNPTDSVIFYDYDKDGIINGGSSTIDLTIQKGILAFETGVDLNLDFSDLIIESDGTFIATDAQTDFEGNFTNNNGVFEHNFGTFRVDKNGGQQTYTSTNTDQFYNFIMEPAHTSKLNITSGDSLRVNGLLQLIEGELKFGYMLAAGDVEIESTFDRGSAALVFVGANEQTLDMKTSPGNFNGNVIIKKSEARSIILLSDFTMDDSGSNLYLNKGYLVSSSSALFTVGQSVNTTGVNDSSFVDGLMRKVGNDAFIFPTGDQKSMATILISKPSLASDAFDAEYFLEDPDPLFDVNSKASSLHHVSVYEYWTLTQSSGSTNITPTLYWDTPRSGGGIGNLSELSVASWDGTEWTDLGNYATSGTTSTGKILALSAENFRTNSLALTLASTTANNALPVDLVSFEVDYIRTHVYLNWVTASEVKNDFFIVERSSDKLSWVEIETVEGAGNSAVAIEYSFEDERPYRGVNYYRLKQVDLDGSFIYSDTRSVFVDLPSTSNNLIIYPNPVLGILNIRANPAELQTLKMFDNYGLEIKPRITYQIEGLVQIDMSSLKSGIYFLRTQYKTAKIFKSEN